ncbi:MAG: DUF2809 domain-containing protein [Candidatus Cloacimonetes bacterium]|nr:DUF2809 domain-containing protein [Candidatus Cloacimonadota bacterium]
MKQRIITLLSLLFITPLGFLCKFYSGVGAKWLNDSFGGLLYEIFWCLVVFLILPKFKPINIAIGVFIVTCVLEIMQLWHPPFLELTRSNFIGRTVIGTSFVWSDFIYYVLGSTLGWLWLASIRKINEQRRGKTTERTESTE